MKHPILSQNIKLMMGYLDLTAQEFADKFEIKRGMVESYKQGKAVPKFDFTQKLCSYFNITKDQLLKQELSLSDLRITGRMKSITEIQLEEALKRVALLENTVEDLRKMIKLMESGTKPSRE